MFGDITKAFGRTFLLAHFAPAIIFVVANATLAFWGVIPSIPANYQRLYSDSLGILLLIAAFACALLLALIQTTIIRLYEGYEPSILTIVAVSCLLLSLVAPYGPAPHIAQRALVAVSAISFALLLMYWPLKWLHRLQYWRMRRDINRLPEDGDKRGMKEYWMRRRYAPDPQKVMPTQLGNILRAFESYANHVYGMDSITMWFRLSAVIPKDYRDQIADAESSVYAMLNLSFVLAVVAGEVLVETKNILSPYVWPGPLAILLSYICYRAACSSARRDWGEYVRAAFDLYRLDLLKQLGIETGSQPFWADGERKWWQHAQLMTFYNEPPRGDLRIVPRD